MIALVVAGWVWMGVQRKVCGRGLKEIEREEGEEEEERF